MKSVHGQFDLCDPYGRFIVAARIGELSCLQHLVLRSQTFVQVI